MEKKSKSTKETKECSLLSRRNFLAGTVAAVGAAVLHNPLGAAENPLIKNENPPPSRNAEMPIIDVHRHCHWTSSVPMEIMMENTFWEKVGWRKHPYGETITVDGISVVAYPELMNIDLQVQKQDEAGVTMSILSSSMQLELLCRELSFLPEADVSQSVNDKTAALVAKHPKKLAFMAMVNPLRNDSLDECDRCLNKLGAKGVNISTSWQGEYLDSDDLNPFWEYAQTRDVAVYLHPPLIPIGYQKMNRYRLEEVIGRPFDTTMTIARMIYSGVFDRYPKLKVVLPHMGGGLPSVIGRLDFGYRLGYDGLPKGEEAVCKKKPSDYLKTNLYVDCMGFSPAGVRHCLDLFGVDRVMFGTDYGPVTISPKEHIQIIKNLGLSREDEAKIFWKNANKLFHVL